MTCGKGMAEHSVTHLELFNWALSGMEALIRGGEAQSRMEEAASWIQ